MKLTPCKLKEIVREEAQRLSEIGWDNLPDGWDEESVDSFAQNLTGQEGEEGFFSACMDEVEDKFDDPEAFCASLKDEYLGTTDWRGESVNKSDSMKLTESKLRQIIREEMEALGGEKYLQDFQQYLSSTGREVGRQGLAYEYKGYHVSLQPVDYYMEVTLYRDKNDREAAASARIEDDAVRLKRPDPGQRQVGRRGQMPRPQTQNVRYKSPEQVLHRLVSLAEAN